VIRVTADSNIYISVLHFGGPPDDFLSLARAGLIHLIISDDILDEVTRVLRDKFGWTKEAVSLARERIGDFSEEVMPQEKVNAVKEDPTDNRILEWAIAGKSEYLVTRDNHLLNLKSFKSTEIIKVADFLEMIRKQGIGR
jgi:putative PIN family toxin of toxin-antitoxin system